MAKITNLPVYKHNIENIKNFGDEINSKIREFFSTNLKIFSPSEKKDSIFTSMKKWFKKPEN